MQLFEISYAYKFLGGFYFALSVLHIILFIYNRNRKANLIYAVGLLLVFINFTFTQEVESWSWAYRINILTDLAANGALLYYISNFILASSLPGLKKVIRTFGLIYAAGFISLILNFNSDFFNSLQIILRTAIYIVTGLSCVLGLIRKIANFHLIVLATLFLMIMWVFFGTDLFNIWGNRYPILRVFFILTGFISPFIAYSYYLSRYLSKTKKNLVQEHIINEQLLLSKLQAEKIHELGELKSRFFANISHEFRTPLTLILNPLQKRIEQVTDHDEKTELAVMHRNASRLLTLVNQLLDLSRLEAGSLKLKCAEADLHQAIASVASQFSSMADSKEILFTVQSSKPVYIFFDQDKLENIIINLISNAFKFTPSGGSINISIKIQSPSDHFKSGCAEIIVTDTGTGIEAEHLSKIFDRFYQVDMSSTRAYEGSGIGLSLTKELVELHRGTIDVESQVNKGSTFVVRLPLGNAHLKPEEIVEIGYYDLLKIETIPSLSPTPNEAIEHESTHEESILIIEDNGDLRTYLQRELKNHYKVIEAIDGEDGITKAIAEIPTLIISDLMMPKKDGLTLCNELKQDERTSHIPIILLTSKADIDSKLQGYNQGADDYIAKPFNLNELQTRIKNLIALRKKLQSKFSQHQTILPSEIQVDSADGRFLKKAVAIIETHLVDFNFGVEPLAKELAVSQTQLYRKMQAVTGSGPNEFIRHIRLLRAADMLRNKTGNVSEIAYQVGFNNLSYFSKVFKEKFNVTPMEFLKNHNGKDASN